MASGLYTKFLEAMMSGSVNLLTADVRAVLIDQADYTVNLATHEFLSSVPAAARVGTAVALANKSVTGGAFDADDATLTSVTGDQSEAVLLYIHTGSDATARLILLAESDTVTNLPVTPNGGNINLVWSNGANKIFKLAA
jgi:hypothetical protein